MSGFNIYSFTVDDLTANANIVKDLLRERLDLPVLDEYVVVVNKPSVFGRAVAHIKGLDDKNAMIVVAKVVRLKQDEP